MHRNYILLFLLFVAGWGTEARGQPDSRPQPRAVVRTVQFNVKPAALQLNPELAKIPTALVCVKVENSGGAKVELIALHTNVGQLSKPKSLGNDTWVATFTPPSLRFPTVAIIRSDLKINGRLVRRWRAVPISIRLKLPVMTKGAGEISVSVGNREFGPVEPKKHQKEILVPIVIPPGAGNYTISRISKQGITSAETKRFSLPAFPRIAVVGPKSPSAGSLIRLDVFHVGAKGKRFTYNVPLLIDCVVGRIVKMSGLQSVQTIWIKLAGKTGQSRIRVFLKQDAKIEAIHSFTVQLATSLKLLLSATPTKIAMNSAKSVKVLVKVTDLFGNTAGVSTLKVTANGKPLSVARLQPGLWRGWLYPPSKRQPGDRILLRASAARAEPGKAEVKLIGDLAAKLSIRITSKAIMADGKRGVDVEITAVDRLGMAPRDKTVKVESAHGKMAYLHQVRPGLFRGKFVPKRNTAGGVAVVTASTYRAHAVSARFRLVAIPQNMQLSTVLGVLSDAGRAVGIGGQVRYEYSVYQGFPAVHVGLGAMVAPHFSVGKEGAADPFVGFSAGLTGLARLRLLSLGSFALDVVMDIGVIGIYAAYKRYNPPTVDDRSRAQAAFTTSIAVEMGFHTVRRNEVFIQLRMRYLTASYHDASTDNHVSLFAGVGYRFEL